jgi:hypothetical protein
MMWGKDGTHLGLAVGDEVHLGLAAGMKQEIKSCFVPVIVKKWKRDRWYFRPAVVTKWRNCELFGRH